MIQWGVLGVILEQAALFLARGFRGIVAHDFSCRLATEHKRNCSCMAHLGARITAYDGLGPNIVELPFLSSLQGNVSDLTVW